MGYEIASLLFSLLITGIATDWGKNFKEHKLRNYILVITFITAFVFGSLNIVAQHESEKISAVQIANEHRKSDSIYSLLIKSGSENKQILVKINQELMEMGYKIGRHYTIVPKGSFDNGFSNDFANGSQQSPTDILNAKLDRVNKQMDSLGRKVRVIDSNSKYNIQADH